MRLWLLRFPEHQTYRSVRVAARTQSDAMRLCPGPIENSRYVFCQWFGHLKDPCKAGIRLVTYQDGRVEEYDPERPNWHRTTFIDGRVDEVEAP